MKASDYIADFLDVQGVTCVFELAGGMITHLLDSLHNKGKIKIVSVHHEQSAAFAADAFGRVTGVPGVALATSGPGATNLLTGIASCYFDSSPGVFITGQVNTYEQKGDREIRQLGFQETDIVRMAVPITKKTFSIRKSDEIVPAFEEAFKIAISGRPGPVLIDLPMDIQRSEVRSAVLRRMAHDNGNIAMEISREDSDFVIGKLREARRPLVLVGRGVHSAFVIDELIRFVEKANIPVVSSLLAIDVLPYEHPLRVGFIGSYGNRWANIALGTCDYLLVLGSRLDIRQTGADVESFANGKTIIQVDCERPEINNRVRTHLGINVDIKDFLDKMNSIIDGLGSSDNAKWLEEIGRSKKEWPDINELKGINGINPNLFIHKMSTKSKGIKYFFADVGNHQMWMAQSLELLRGQRFLTSGGMGAMGSGLPAAIGACLADNNSPALLVAGDGGFQVNIQELQTVVRNKLPIKVIILNNNSLGMIRQFQDSYFGSRYQSSHWGYSAPNFELVAKAYGIESLSIDNETQIDEALDWLVGDLSTPQLLQVYIDMHANAYPKMAFGKPITEMEPLSKPLDMEGT